MCKRFILLLGMFMCSHAPVAGQTAGPQILLAQEHGAQIVTMPRTVSLPLMASSFLLFQVPGKPNTHFSLQFAGTYPRDASLDHFSPMDQVKTLTLTQSSLPLFQLWDGRLQLGAFQSTLRSQDVQRSLSVHSSGFALSFYFGRDSRTKPPTLAWRRLTRFVGSVLN